MEKLLFTVITLGLLHEIQSLIEGKKADSLLSNIYSIMYLVFTTNCLFIDSWSLPSTFGGIILMSFLAEYKYNGIKLSNQTWFARLDAIICIILLLLTIKYH